MKQGYTHISVVMDRSGSMQRIKTDTEGGFNAFLDEQKALPGEATISLTIFDDWIDPVYTMLPIQDAPLFRLEPRGATALLDAIGVTINALGVKLAAMDEADRPEKVVFVIVTDGEENQSKEYTYASVAALIKEQTDTFKWEFLFLGANQDAIAAGGLIGIARGKSMSFAPSSAGVGNTYNTVSKNLSNYRSAMPGTAVMDFSEEDRASSMLPDPQP